MSDRRTGWDNGTQKKTKEFENWENARVLLESEEGCRL